MVTIIGLLVILVFVLVLPFAFHHIERNLEAFLFVMGILAVTIGGGFNMHLIKSALEHPIPITAAVLVMGLIFKWTRKALAKFVRKTLKIVPIRIFVFIVILVLGMTSSVITVIIASLVLVEVVSLLMLDRKAEIHIVIVACFAMGMGAALTPIGEPLSTIAIGKLSGEPYHAGFWFLVDKIGPWVIPGVVAFAILSFFFHEKKVRAKKDSLTEIPEEVKQDESYADVFIRAGKVYLFIMALVFLGEGFKPLIDRFVIQLPSLALFWINSISAILDNATLTAAELSARMDLNQIRDILLGLLISGGMLIPGNIPNIIAASKLKIKMKEWAKFAVPLGLVTMCIYFILLMVIRGDKPPVLSVSAPAANATVQAPFDVTARALDDEGVSEFVLSIDGKEVQTHGLTLPVPKNGTAVFKVEADKITPGKHTLTVEVADNTGHRVKKEIHITVKKSGGEIRPAPSSKKAA
ncbi:MAG: DUF1646 family protein [Acidobacteriota bacterium]